MSERYLEIAKEFSEKYGFKVIPLIKTAMIKNYKNYIAMNKM